MCEARQQEITWLTGETPRAVVTDNNEPRAPGRRSVDDLFLAEKGEQIRSMLTAKLAANNMLRPMQHDMHYNEYGNVYMSS